jgi:NAD(P)-dependent dehydrogenase (short-subunit alcohol dehydrogenase family)
VADLVAQRAAAVAAEVETLGQEALAVTVDVTDLASMQATADATLRRFGTVNLVCNNAGVCKGGSIEATSPGDARWMFEVNVFGMYHGIHVFAPLLREAAARGEPAWILNTGSENSLGIPPVGAVGIYNATKHAVLALSDNARHELAASGIGVSVLCPALVRTDLLDSQMHRHDRWGGPRAMDEAMKARVDALMAAKGHDVDETAAIALDGVQAGEFLIVPHAEVRPFVEARIRTVQAALDAADARGKGTVG